MNTRPLNDTPSDTGLHAGLPSELDTEVQAPPVYRKPWWQALREADERRPDLPGEHVVVLGVGLLLLVSAGRSSSIGGRLFKAALGGALVGRAASGRGGMNRLVHQATRLADRYLPR